jgi:predicted PurR-regulated permease PerM
VTAWFEDRAFQAALRAGSAVLLLLAAVVFVQRAWEVLQPLLVSVVLATALWPWVSRLRHARLGKLQWHLPRALAAAIVYVVTFTVAGCLIWAALGALLPEIDRGLTTYPDQTGFIRDALQPFRTGNLAQGASELASNVARQATGQAANSSEQVQNGPINSGALTLALFGGIVQLAMVLVFTFFLLLEGGRFASWGLRLVPWDRRPHVQALGLRVRDRISNWVLAQAIYGSVSGIVIWLTLLALQLPSPWLYGIIGATFGIFPGLGPWIAYLPAFAVALGLSVWQATGVLVLCVAMYVVDSTTLSTKIYGELLQLPMFVVLLALLVGGALMGVWGAMIAAPVAAGLQSVLEDRLDSTVAFEHDRSDPQLVA